MRLAQLLILGSLLAALPARSGTEVPGSTPPPAARLLLSEASTAQTKESSCLSCCRESNEKCQKDEGRMSQRCEKLLDNCVTHCRSSGETPSDWACWGK